MSEDQKRKDFEEWMGDGGLSQRALERNSNGDYILMQAASAWHVWKAAHAHYAKPAAPVVWPEPVAAQSRFVPALSDGWGFCSVAQARRFARENYEVRLLYTRAQVEAMLEAQGTKL